MDNKEIKEMFDKLQKDVVKNTEEEKKDHKEIGEWIRKLCDRITSTENTLDNHLINSEKKEKTRREKISYVVAGIGILLAILSVYVKI